MPNYTENLGLTKPLPEEFYDINVQNENMDKIDEELVKKYNPNLLDNWYFADPINQRGQTEYVGTGYTIDRWKSVDNSTVVRVADGGIVLSSSYVQTEVWSQYFEESIKSLLAGRTITLSLLTKDGVLLTQTSTVNTNGTIDSMGIHVSGGAFDVFCHENNRFVVRFVCTDANVETPVISAIKLELGSNQTLAHKEGDTWVLNTPPLDKALELLKCIQSTADSADTYANKVIYHTGNKDQIFTYGTSDLTAGTSSLETGKLYFVYE